jgi:hypothetical protein
MLMQSGRNLNAVELSHGQFLRSPLFPFIDACLAHAWIRRSSFLRMIIADTSDLIEHFAEDRDGQVRSFGGEQRSIGGERHDGILELRV